MHARPLRAIPRDRRVVLLIIRVSTAPLRHPKRGFSFPNNSPPATQPFCGFGAPTTMSHPDSTSSPSQGVKRCLYFSTDGVSLISLPIRDDEALALIDSTHGNIRLLRFAPADAEQIKAALDAGATFRFMKNTLHLAAPSGRLEFAARAPDDAAASPPALPGPRDIQRLHDASNQPHVH